MRFEKLAHMRDLKKSTLRSLRINGGGREDMPPCLPPQPSSSDGPEIVLEIMQVCPSSGAVRERGLSLMNL